MEPGWEKKITMKKSSVDIDENFIGVEEETQVQYPK